MQIQNNKQISFSGLKLNSTLDAKKLTKLNEFISDRKNIKLIAELEDKLKTDVVIYEDPSIISFEHKKYGSFRSYGLTPIKAEQFAEKADQIKSYIEKAIEKAKNTWDKILDQGTLH